MNNTYISKSLLNILKNIIENYNKNNDIIKINSDFLNEKLGSNIKISDINEFLNKIFSESISLSVELINIILQIIDEKNQSELIKIIKLEKNIYYFDKEYVKKFEKSYYSMNEGDQISYKNYIEDSTEESHINYYIILTAEKKGNIFYYDNIIINKNIEESSNGENKNNFIRINDYLVYDKVNYLFKNEKNNKEYNIFMHGDYDVMMDVLLDSPGNYISFEGFWKMQIFKDRSKNSISEKNKKLTDTKNNFLKILKNNLDTDEKLDFIVTQNGFKIVIK